ncbi:MAG: hypothetical protein CL949_08390 [Erythrobacter sp.]|nr:hypothetical protein [Erythrobacter sp.]
MIVTIAITTSPNHLIKSAEPSARKEHRAHSMEALTARMLKALRPYHIMRAASDTERAEATGLKPTTPLG